MENLSQNHGSSTLEEELLKALLKIDDPRDLPGLVEEIPEGVDLVEIVHVYHFKTEKIKCAVCHAPRHNKGYVVALSNHTRALVGHVCGEQFFQGSWRAHHATFNYRLKLQDNLRRVRPLKQVIDNAQEWLKSWREPLANFDSCRRDFKRVAPELYDMLDRAAHKADGVLFIPRRIRNTAAEEIRDLQLPSSERGKRTPIYSEVLLRTGQFRGRAFFNMRDPSDLLLEAESALRLAKRKLERSKLTNRDMQEAFRFKEDAARLLERANETFSARQEFFKTENLETIARWANDIEAVPGTYKASADSLVKQDRWHDSLTITMPDIPELNLTIIGALRSSPDDVDVIKSVTAA